MWATEECTIAGDVSGDLMGKEVATLDWVSGPIALMVDALLVTLG